MMLLLGASIPYTLLSRLTSLGKGGRRRTGREPRDEKRETREREVRVGRSQISLFEKRGSSVI